MRRFGLVNFIMTGCLMLGSAACASAPELPAGEYVETQPAPEPAPPEPVVVGVPYAQPVTGQLVPMPERSTPTDEEIEQAKRARLSPKEVIDEANERARLSPTPEGFVHAQLVYDYIPGLLYRVWGAPNHLTTIEFAPGEEILRFGLGDTVQWQVRETISGSGSTRRSILVMEPRFRNLHTTMVVTTSIGTYIFELESFRHSYNALVTFRHPRQQLMQLGLAAQGRQTTGSAAAVDTMAQSEGASGQGRRGQGMELAVDLADVEDRYRLIVENKRRPPRWAPKRVFHDGVKTYIDFGTDLGEREVPSVAIYTTSKTPRLVQSKVHGRYIIVGEVIEVGVLSMGAEREETVGLELAKGARR